LWDRYPSLWTIITFDKRGALAIKSHHVPYETGLYPAGILVLYAIQFCFAGSFKFKNYNTSKPEICLHQTGEIVEQGVLMSPNPSGKLEDLAASCVCCLIVFEMLIHSLR